MEKGELLKFLNESQSESTNIDFKSMVDWTSNGDQIEIIKDIVAFANSGGGCIGIGINDDGSLNENYQYRPHEIDPSVIINKIKKYTGVEFGDIEFTSTHRDGKEIQCIVIKPATKPIVFEKPGTYPDPKDPAKQQKTAFGQGTVYFRHGAKSETCNNHDLSHFVDRSLEQIRDSWLGNIRKVVEAPIGHVVHMLPPNVIMKETDDATPIRITEDKDAPAYKIEHPDSICPYRQRELLKMLNEEIKSKEKINQYDLLAITSVYKIDNNKPNFFYRSLYGPKQYSKSFIEWIISQYNEDNDFFFKTREMFRINKEA